MASSKNGRFDTKLRALITSARDRRGSYDSSAVACTEIGQVDAPGLPPHDPDASDLKQLLHPTNVAFLQSELRTAYGYAGLLAHDEVLETTDCKLLNISLLALMLEKQPDHPSHVEPKLVSHHSDVMVAAQAGDDEALDKILSTSPSLAYTFTLGYFTPMFFAISSGSIAAVQCLLRHGVCVNDMFGRIGTTPLAAALQFRQLHIARLLIHSGALLDHKNPTSNWSLLFYLWFKDRRQESADELLTLLWASSHFESMHKDIYDNEGWHLSHLAMRHGTPEDVLKLKEYGVDLFATTRGDHHTVLQEAVLCGRADMVNVLLPFYIDERGNADLPDVNGWTLLHMAVEERHLDIVQILIDHGASLTAVTKETASGLAGHDQSHIYNAFSLAKEGGPSFYKQFRDLVKLHLTRSASIHKHDRQPRLHTAMHPPAQQSYHLERDCRKSFGDTEFKGVKRAHQGDNLNCHTYKITHINLNKKCSAAFLKENEFRRKFLKRQQWTIESG